jgi:hypothetical protein
MGIGLFGNLRSNEMNKKDKIKATKELAEVNPKLSENEIIICLDLAIEASQRKHSYKHIIEHANALCNFHTKLFIRS